MKAAANLSLLWPELPFLDRFDAAATAGFKAVEVLFPYETPAKSVQSALGKNGLELILINAPPPNYTGGARGFAAVPGGEDRFDHDMRRAFRYAQALGVQMIHVMAGYVSGDAAKATMIANLSRACSTAPKGVTLMLEPLCAQAQPEYFLNDYALATEVIEAVGAPNLSLQFDSFHAQMIHGDACAVFERYHVLIHHIQIGDAPDRGALGRGTIDFNALFEAVRTSNYEGYISGEYHPGAKTEDTLGWMTFGA